ncbi:MAG: Crp/Fnr family transcriptional regulator [Gammaproteobacteria bacterium]|nr:Crp/Fnr family transcriptional regulator [Gammaproteobacteria bacterium]
MNAEQWRLHDHLSSRSDNHFLKSLPEDAYLRLRPFLETFDVPNGYVIPNTRAAYSYLYFPLTCVLNIQGELTDGATTEVATIGRYGFFGVNAMMGVSGMGGSAIAIHGGRMVRLRNLPGGSILMSVPSIVRDMLRYFVFRNHLATMAVICQRHHSLEQRLAHWLTMMRIQTRIDDLDVTHEQLGRLLGVRREGVSEAMKHLEVAGIVSQTRGHLHLADPSRLRHHACGCLDESRAIHAKFFPNRTLDFWELLPGSAPAAAPNERRESACVNARG